MFCKSCGAKIPDDSKFCKECGARCAEESAQMPFSGTMQKKPKKTMWILLTCIVLAAAVCVILLAVFRGQSKTDVSERSGKRITENAVTTSGEESSETDAEKKALEQDDAKAVYEAANAVFKSMGLSDTGMYHYGNDTKIDKELDDKCDFLKNYEDIAIYTADGTALSVVCYGKETDGTLTYSTYPTYCTDAMLNSGVSVLYLALDDAGKITANNIEAEKCGTAIEKALTKMEDAGTPMQDGTYTLRDCGDLADYMDVSRFDLYQTVDFEVYTASSGQQKCTVILSVDGTYCSAYPVKTTLDNWSDHTLKDGIEK